MTGLIKPTRRVTQSTYKHYRKPIVITLWADVISLRLKGTRTSYEIPVEHLMDDLCRREARRRMAEKKANRKKHR